MTHHEAERGLEPLFLSPSKKKLKFSELKSDWVAERLSFELGNSA
jgi:hypothetical protein